jgi:hypothetical protein
MQFAVGVHHAVTSSAEKVSVIVTNAVAGEDKRNDTKGQSTSYSDTKTHDISDAASSEAVCRG